MSFCNFLLAFVLHVERFSNSCIKIYIIKKILIQLLINIIIKKSNYKQYFTRLDI